MAGSLAVTSCLGGSTEPVSVSGIYELQTINNQKLPFSFATGAVITKEIFTVNADGSFTDVATRQDGTVISDQGSYSNFGGTINFVDQTLGIVYQGFVEGQTLTTKIGGFSSAYTRTGPAPH